MKHYLDLVSISNKVHRRQSRMTRICIVLAVFLVAVMFKYRGGLGTVCSHAAAQHCMVWLYAYLWH